MIKDSFTHALRFTGMVLFFLHGNFATSVSAEEKPTPVAPLRIATVEMRELYQEYFRSGEMEKEMRIHQARIQKENNERVARSKELEDKLGKIRTQLEDPALNDSKKQSLFKTWQAGQQEVIDRDRERREFVQRRSQAFNEEMARRMKGILEEIRKIVEEQAKLDNFDYVFDRSGRSSSQVPLLLFTKDSTDITAILLKRLNRDAPAENPVTKAGDGSSFKVEADH